MKKRRRRQPPYSPAIWIKIINDIKRGSENAIENIKEIVDETIGAINHLLAFGGKIDTYRFPISIEDMGGDAEVFSEEGEAGIKLREIISKPAIGVDSSISRPVRIGHRYYAVVDAALIRFDNIFVSEPEERIWAKLAEAPDAADPAYAKAELNLSMFYMELDAILEAANMASYGTVVFIDGPIIDPPTPPPDGGLGGRYQEYLEKRAKAIHSIIEKGGLPIGVVKRVRGALIVQQLAEIISREGLKSYAELLRRHRIGDYSLALYASLALRYAAGNQRLVPVLRYVELRNRVFEEQGVRVLSFLMVPRMPGIGTESRPVRVEVAVPADLEEHEARLAVKKAAASVAAWLVPGLNVPKPIMLAHARCTIRDRDSRRLLMEMLSRSLYYAALRGLPESAPDTVAAIV